VCYLTLCDASYPKKLAHAFIDEIKKEFDIQYGAEVRAASRPYAFIKFGTRIPSPAALVPAVARSPRCDTTALERDRASADQAHRPMLSLSLCVCAPHVACVCVLSHVVWLCVVITHMVVQRARDRHVHPKDKEALPGH
jgi:hypothetical protein